MPTVTFEEFKKLDLRVGRIIEAENHPNADRLFVVKVEWGEGPKQLVAGIRNKYSIETLIGRQVVVVANLEPAAIRGVESQGMILAAADENGVSILSLDR